MSPIKLVILDVDGTISRGVTPIPNAIEAVDKLRQQGIAVRVLTNNSALTRTQLATKLERMGFDFTVEEVFGTGNFSALYCRERDWTNPYVVGDPGLTDCFREVGLEPNQAGQADVVVAGICRGLTYSWIDGALQHLIGGAAFLATNRDSSYPLEGGRIQPGAAATVAAIEAVSGIQPVVLGKPNPIMVESICQSVGVQPEECLMVGDRYETDILCAQAAHCVPWLVMTGVTHAPITGVGFSDDLSGLPVFG